MSDEDIDKYLSERKISDATDQITRAIAKREIEIEAMKGIGSVLPIENVHRERTGRQAAQQISVRPMKIVAKSMIKGRGIFVDRSMMSGFEDISSDTLFGDINPKRYGQSS